MSIFDSLIPSISGNFNRSVGVTFILNGNKKQKVDPATKIQQILDQAKFDNNRQQIMRGVGLRIRGIAEGTIPPKEVWEKVAGFLAQTGQPFTYTVSQAGEIDIQPQSLDDLSFVPLGQRPSMRAALQRLDEVRKEVDTINTKANLRNRLLDAVDRIGKLQQFAPPNAQWERDFNLYRKMGQPVMIGLSPTGDVRAINQLDSSFDYVEDPAKRLILQNASRDLKNILKGDKSATETWHYTALGNKLAGDDYFLDVDDSNQVVVRRNTAKRGVSTTQPAYQQTGQADYHIIPEFLRASRADQNIFKADWERQAADMILSKKPFHLDAFGGGVIVRPTDFNSARRLDLLDFNGARTRIGQATINILS